MCIRDRYRRTLDLIEEIGFDQVNTAAYSPRPNTPAAHWDNQLPEEVKVERLREINALVERCARKANARYEGRTEEVLAEGINPKDPSQLMGLSLIHISEPTRRRTISYAVFSIGTMQHRVPEVDRITSLREPLES